MSMYQDLYDSVFIECQNVLPNTFDYLPGDSKGYPFIFVGELMGTEDVNLTGILTQSIHLWASRDDRRTFNRILSEVKARLRLMKNARGYSASVRSVTQNVLIEGSDSNEKLHGILEVEFLIT